MRTALENAQFRLQNSKEGFPEGTDHAILAEFEQRFVQEMDDDFNAANGITVVYELAKWLNTYSESASIDIELLTAAVEKFKEWLAIFGIYFVGEELLDEEIEQLIEERIQARQARDFARSDEIRDVLKEKGLSWKTQRKVPGGEETHERLQTVERTSVSLYWGRGL